MSMWTSYWITCMLIVDTTPIESHTIPHGSRMQIFRRIKIRVLLKCMAMTQIGSTHYFKYSVGKQTCNATGCGVEYWVFSPNNYRTRHYIRLITDYLSSIQFNVTIRVEPIETYIYLTSTFFLNLRIESTISSR